VILLFKVNKRAGKPTNHNSMPYIDALSDAEILALTDEQVEKIIKLKMAEDGVKILQKPEEPEYHEIPEGNEMLFKVTGAEALFSDRVVANEVLELLQKHRESLKETSYTHNYHHRFQKDFHLDYHGKPETLGIMPERVYSKDLLASIKEDISANEDIKKRYNERKEEYENSNEDAERIKGEVWDKVYEVRRKQANKEAAYARFQEYLVLSENDTTQAMVFYKKAYSPDDETIQYIEAELLKEETED